MIGTIVFWAVVAAFVLVPVVGLVLVMGARKRRTPRGAKPRAHGRHRSGR